MALVNKQFVQVADVEIVAVPVERPGRGPVLPAEINGVRILNNPVDVGGDLFMPTRFGMNKDLYLTLMDKPILI